MRLAALELRNFKRFTDLTLEGIPETAQLVVLIGANGSGKSSVFDAFEFLSGGAKREGRARSQQGYYYRKVVDADATVEVMTVDGVRFTRSGDTLPEGSGPDQFYGRSSVRIVPRATPISVDQTPLNMDWDGPREFILPDERFNLDVQLYTAGIDRLLRESVISGSDTSPRAIRDEHVAPLNESLLRVFGDDPALGIQLTNWQSAEVNKAPVLEFQKGSSRLPYDLLSHGEKQVVILLLNFMVRRELLEDKVIFIDEMDNHMHRSLQYRLLEEIVEHWIPASSQLWTATHAVGFIEYAYRSPNAVVFDFDELDFDVPQVLTPSPRAEPGMFDVAIGPDLVAELATHRRVVFVEGNDRRYYDQCELGYAFLRSDNKQHAFIRAQAIAVENVYCLLDRDFLTDDERTDLLSQFPFMRMLASYSVENELFHSATVAEVFAARGEEFDLQSYESAWAADLRENLSTITANVNAVRQTYGFFFDDTAARKRFVSSGGAVVDLLHSNDFDVFYPVFPAKSYGREAKRLLGGVTPDDLARTTRFRDRIAAALA